MKVLIFLLLSTLEARPYNEQESSDYWDALPNCGFCDGYDLGYYAVQGKKVRFDSDTEFLTVTGASCSSDIHYKNGRRYCFVEGSETSWLWGWDYSSKLNTPQLYINDPTSSGPCKKTPSVTVSGSKQYMQCEIIGNVLRPCAPVACKQHGWVCIPKFVFNRCNEFHGMHCLDRNGK
ncbi:ORF23 [White sturgeon adenovirus 1]|uniref:ORF23 n=1 Tax=White sturgeon adenovirus 1 TaxID=2580388 RepID=A0A4P8PIP9_9ADEN|nr:ORF23 [White sturgeon adenovirus 1]QCQ84171.1 ORF23 [White sturgeon adenovirus 1]